MRSMTIVFLVISFFSTCIFGNTGVQVERQWQVKDIGTLKLFDEASARDLNDSGMVLLQSGHSIFSTWAIGNIETGATVLPKLPIIYPNMQHATEIEWQRINKSGVALGFRYCYTPNASFDAKFVTPELITWEHSKGLKQYSISSATHKNYSAKMEVIQCGNSSHIVFNVNDSIFTLEKENLTDLSPVLLKEIQKIGFNFYEVKWTGIAVNDNKNIYGKFECFDKHPFKEKSVLVEERYFLWDGKNITLIETPADMIIWIDSSWKHLNNNNEVLINSGNRSWLWSKVGGFVEVTRYDPQGNYEGRAIAVLDDRTIIFLLGNKLLVQSGHESSLLEYYDKMHSDNIDTSEYQYKISGKFNRDICLVNNKKQIVLWGTFLKEDHPFLLTPKEERDSY